MNTQNFEAQRFSTPDLLSMLIGCDEAKIHSNTPLSVLFGMRANRHDGVVRENTPTYTPKETLLAAKELVMRAIEEELTETPISFHSPKEVKSYVKLLLGGRQQEVFVALFLDAQHRLIAADELFHGTLTQTSVYPREVVKRALSHNAAAVIFSHNHPSGMESPSQADRLLTNALKDALRLVDVRVIDHLIVGETQVLSFAETGEI